MRAQDPAAILEDAEKDAFTTKCLQKNPQSFEMQSLTKNAMKGQYITRSVNFVVFT